jgi:hypothetical protein
MEHGDLCFKELHDLCLLDRFGLEHQKFGFIHFKFEMPDISNRNTEWAIGDSVWNPRERSGLEI